MSHTMFYFWQNYFSQSVAKTYIPISVTNLSCFNLPYLWFTQFYTSFTTKKKKEVFKIVTLSEMIIIQEEFLESSYLNSYVFSSETTIKTRSFRMHKMALYPLVFHGLHKKAIHTANCDEKLSYWKTAEYEKWNKTKTTVSIILIKSV